MCGEADLTTFYFLNCPECEIKSRAKKNCCLNCLKTFTHMPVTGCCCLSCSKIIFPEATSKISNNLIPS